ncbi:hypothetical protein E4U42_003179 [Claviceps africana]|uniref:Amine oxidase domain-containing protein n=1 Tax=Claviceps africana TaxID=83212 RepID=A0A8K0J9N4_9HYPO|nr:hypothetical protein E4U42_003179 [Claviceps africana]
MGGHGMTQAPCALGLVATLLAPLVSCDTAAPPQDENTMVRDVAILGGGATGMYAAVQLTKQGHSVVLVEKKDVLGGHAETLYLPDGAGHIDYGVEGYFNNALTRDLFDLLQVDHEALLPASFTTQHVNFRTGAKVPGNGNILGILSGAVLYRAAIQKYHYLASGTYDLPDPVPEELLRPFREFVEKHLLQGALSAIFMFAENVGDLLETPLLYVIQNFGIPQINALLEGGYIRPVNGTQQLFRAAAAYIGEESNILYSSTVSRASRSDDAAAGVHLTVTNALSGATTAIRAKKLLVTYPPTLDSMANLALQPRESDLFSRWDTKAYFAAAITNTGLPDVNIANVDPANKPGGLPLPPFQWELEYSGVPGYHMTKIVAAANFTAHDAEALIRADLKRMRDAGTFHTNDPEIAALASHSPETLVVPVDEVRDGFYRKLYALQGLQNTYYTGYTFCMDYSSVLWEYTSSVLDMMHLS